MRGLCAPSSPSWRALSRSARSSRLLAVGGVIDDDASTSSTSAAAPSPPTANNNSDDDDGKGGAPADISELYKRVSPGVVFIQAGQNATGSGLRLDKEGHIVTNDHVVEGSTQFQVVIGGDPQPIPARLMGQDPSSDLAVLKVDPGAVKGGLKPLELGDCTTLEPGDQAIAIGSPFGLEGTVTTGIISSLGRTIDSPNCYPIADAVQTDAAINPGNSGGPLLDGNGRVIGVNSQIRSGSGANSGVGFAVPVSTVKFVVPLIKNGGKVERAYLGVRNGTPPDRSGALVDSVVPNGPAAQRRPPARRQDHQDRRQGRQVLRGRLLRGYRPQARGTGQSDGRARRPGTYPDDRARNPSRDAGDRNCR